MTSKTPAEGSNQTHSEDKPDINSCDTKRMRAARFIIIRKTNHSGKRREAAEMFCGGIKSVSVLARYFGVSRNTIYDWKAKDSWDKMSREVDSQMEAETTGRLASFKDDQLKGLLEDLKLIDDTKKSVPARSLEGLLKVKAELLEKVLLLSGEATSRNEQIVVTFGRQAEPTRVTSERGAVPLRPGDVHGQVPQTEALPNVENTNESEGGGQGGDAGKGGSIENHGENVEVANKEKDELPQSSGGSYKRADGVTVIRHGKQLPRAVGATPAERRKNASEGKFINKEA